MKTINSFCGPLTALSQDGYLLFLGVPYAHAARFEYASPVTKWEGSLDASKAGNACPQMRAYHEHLEIPERNFYHKEFRQGITFNYDEDCLNLNIYTPEDIGSGKKYPVMIFIHGGGFDSGANSEGPFDGAAYAKRGIICIFINYRVGILGYFTHPEIQKQFGRNGNFGLDDQLTAIKWVKNNIEAFGGDSENITVAGQSAGAISLQYLCLNAQNEGLFKNAFMISGGGKFPNFALPRPAKETEAYWQDFIIFLEKDFETSDSHSEFKRLKTMDCSKIFDAMDKFKTTRKDNTYNTMPVIDGLLIPQAIQKMIKNPLKVNYLLGYTNCDLYAPLMALIEHKFAKKNQGYIYFFDVDAKGDNKKAFHSSDLNFVFGTLEKSWRPYEEEDKKIAELMQDYIANFVKYGNPNGKNPDKEELKKSEQKSESKRCENNPLPFWKKDGKKALHLTTKGKIKMVRAPYFKLIKNMLFGGKQI
ncbi:MAG: carboxylesterase family protein [Treponema sp.]|nr:carboxylesterase family protein [Treponema sp.]